MPDDPLRERLVGHAALGEELARPPEPTAIRRRAGRRYGVRGLAVLVMALLALVGVQALRGAEVPAVGPAPGPAPAGGGPGSFVADGPGGLVEVSTATGQVVRVLAPSLPPDTSLGGLRPYEPVLSADRASVYYGGACGGEWGVVYRQPLGGGLPVKIADGSGIALTISADASRLAWVDQRCVDGVQQRVTVHDLAGGPDRHWPIPAGVRLSGLALDRDGGRLALVTTPASRSATQLRLLDLRTDDSILDGQVVAAPDAGCELIRAAYRPGDGQLTVVERCPDGRSGQLSLLALDPAGGGLQARLLVFPDGSTWVGGLDFDGPGKHLIYHLAVQDPPETTWWYGEGQSVKIGMGYRNPSW